MSGCVGWVGMAGFTDALQKISVTPCFLCTTIPCPNLVPSMGRVLGTWVALGLHGTNMLAIYNSTGNHNQSAHLNCDSSVCHCSSNKYR
jgi:hypothetical protein